MCKLYISELVDISELFLQVSLMRLEFTGASMRNFIINQKTWGVRVKRENKILEDPAVMSRLGTGTLVDKVDKTSASHKEKVKAVRAWNLRQNWKFGQVNISMPLDESKV